MRTAALIALMALNLASLLASIATIGKPRKPVTAGQTSIMVLVILWMSILIIYLYASGE